MAYTRIPSQHIAYSLVEEERGKDSGRMQTVFLRVSFWGRKLLHYVRNAVPVIFALITEEDKGVVQSGVATSFPGFSPTCPGNEVEWSGC